MTKTKEKENLQNIVFRMTPSEIERLDGMAERLGHTRSHFLRNLVITGIEEGEMFEKLGIMRVAITVRDIYQWMAEKGVNGLSKTLGKDQDK